MTHWKVGLSNGENYQEGIKPFDVIKNELSPWLRLKDYIKKNNLKITSLCLEANEKTFNLPSAGKNPKFRAFQGLEKPLELNYFMQIGWDMGSKDKDCFKVIEAVYNDYKLQLWVDEKNSNCWVLLI